MASKSIRPSIRGVVPRLRLFRRLDIQQPLTWVWGPPGSGKTALVASYLSARRVRSLWYRLDANDADGATFFQELTLDGGRGRVRLRGSASLPSGSTRSFFRALYERLPQRFVLVLDSYDELPPHAPLHDVIHEAVAQLPPGGRIIVTSRGIPPTAFARLRASRAIAEVGWADLRLTAAETRRLARHVAGAVPAKIVAALHARTDGWAAGVVLALQERRSLVDERRGVPDGIADYLTAEIFNRLDPDTRDVLLRTAFLPRVTTALVEALTGRPGAGRALVELHRQSCFVTQRVEGETVYEYAPVFRAFLLRRAHTVFRPEQRREVQRRAANLLTREGRLDAAATLLRAAEDWEGLASLVEANAAGLASRGQLDLVGTWVGAIPDDVVRERGWLLHWRGICRLPGDPAGSRNDFERALGRFREADDATGALLAWAAGVRSFALEHEDYRPLDRWIARFEDLQRRFPAFPSREVETRVAGSMLLALRYRQPHHREITAWARRALDLARTTSDPVLQLQNVQQVLAYRLWTGDFEGAHALAGDLRTLASAADAPAHDRVAAMLAVARLEWLTGAFANARDTVEAGLALARSSGSGRLINRLLAEAVQAALSEGNLSAARQWLGEMRRDLRRHSQGDRVSYRVLVGLHALLAGEVSTAVGE